MTRTISYNTDWARLAIAIVPLLRREPLNVVFVFYKGELRRVLSSKPWSNLVGSLCCPIGKLELCEQIYSGKVLCVKQWVPGKKREPCGVVWRQSMSLCVRATVSLPQRIRIAAKEIVNGCLSCVKRQNKEREDDGWDIVVSMADIPHKAWNTLHS